VIVDEASRGRYTMAVLLFFAICGAAGTYLAWDEGALRILFLVVTAGALAGLGYFIGIGRARG
jgi:hypothetical protein